MKLFLNSMAIDDLAINRKQRLEFVKYWANYVSTHPDKDWSKQQAVLIDSQIQNSRKLMTKELFLSMKGER